MYLNLPFIKGRFRYMIVYFKVVRAYSACRYRYYWLNWVHASLGTFGSDVTRFAVQVHAGTEKTGVHASVCGYIGQVQVFQGTWECRYNWAVLPGRGVIARG